MKKVVKKASVKKPVMKTGGVKKTLKKYQGDVSGSQVSSIPTREEKKEYRKQRRTDRKEFIKDSNISAKTKILKLADEAVTFPKVVGKALIDPEFRKGRFMTRNPFKNREKFYDKDTDTMKKGGSVKAKKKNGKK
jgi:hypothetical protein